MSYLELLVLSPNHKSLLVSCEESNALAFCGSNGQSLSRKWWWPYFLNEKSNASRLYPLKTATWTQLWVLMSTSWLWICLSLNWFPILWFGGWVWFEIQNLISCLLCHLQPSGEEGGPGCHWWDHSHPPFHNDFLHPGSSVLSILYLTLCWESPASEKLTDPTFAWRSRLWGWVMSFLFRWVGFLPGPTMGVPGSWRSLWNGNRTPHAFSRCLNFPCLSVLICQVLICSLPCQGQEPLTPPS